MYIILCMCNLDIIVDIGGLNMVVNFFRKIIYIFKELDFYFGF